MTDKAKILKEEILARVGLARDIGEIENLRIEVLGRSGVLTAELKKLGALPVEQRREAGAGLNALRDEFASALEAKRAALEASEMNERLARNPVDITLSYENAPSGRVHPLTRVKDEVVQIFGAMGFGVAEGPDIEDDWHNFEALNFPPDHPARDTQDTFFTNDGRLLRTQTSNVQIRAMESRGAPIKVITMGRVYRRDLDAMHTPMFQQVEGLYIDRGAKVSMASLKGCLMDFLKAFFDMESVPARFRPHFFPFTEPSAEMDVRCAIDGGGLEIKEDGDRWVEILGCGMVHPNVLANAGVDPGEYQGFAFGMGIERLAMLKYGVSDMRRMFESDLRWIGHYGFDPIDFPSVPSGLNAG